MLHFLLVPVASIALYASDPKVNQYENGNALLRDCTGENAENASAAAVTKSICLGYVEGAADSLAVFRFINKAPACLPDGVDATQLVDVAVSFLRRHPEQRQNSAASLAAAAFVEAWCPK